MARGRCQATTPDTRPTVSGESGEVLGQVIDAPFHLGSLNARDAIPGEGLQPLHQDGKRDVPGPRAAWRCSTPSPGTAAP